MATAHSKGERPLRKSFHEELEQLRLQVELMGVKVDHNLERMRSVVADGDEGSANAAVSCDDEIDAMNVSLTERCYDLLARENPVASDLRFIVSVLRILSELERIGDLALRVVKLNPDRHLWARTETTYDILVSMCETAVEAYRDALRAWSAQDLHLATDLATRVRTMDLHYERLMAELLRLHGDADRRSIPRAHRRPRGDHRRPPALPAHRRPRPPQRRGALRVDPRGGFQAELTEITREILLLAAHVTEAIPAATEALLAGDVDLAQAVIDHDDVLDELALEIEERCYVTLARQQPVATDLRALMAALRMVAEIERSGDLVVNICKVLCALRAPELSPTIRGTIERMGDEAVVLFRTCMDAYAESDVHLASRLEALDDELDRLHVVFLDEIVEWGADGFVREAIQLAMIGRYYERIGDHAVNIGERVRYLIEGQLPAHGGAA